MPLYTLLFNTFGMADARGPTLNKA